MSKYFDLALTIFVNGIIALIVCLVFKLELPVVLGVYGFLASMVNHVNIIKIADFLRRASDETK